MFLAEGIDDAIDALELTFTALLLPEALCVRISRAKHERVPPALFGWGNGLGMLCHWLNEKAVRGQPLARTFVKNKARLWHRRLLLLSLVPVLLVGFGVAPSSAPQAAWYNGALAWWGSTCPPSLRRHATAITSAPMVTSPQKEGVVIASIPPGKPLRLYEHDFSGQWYLARSNASLGWVRSDALRLEPQSAEVR
jgi:hypothetical protein